MSPMKFNAPRTSFLQVGEHAFNICGKPKNRRAGVGIMPSGADDLSPTLNAAYAVWND
jgi:hypothetical protein